MTLQVTIFGGTGFVGRYVVDLLCDRGFTVKVATRRPSSAYFLRTSGTVGQVVPVVCDIQNDDSVLNALKGSFAAINLIGILAEKGRRQRFEKIHSEFPARLGALARAVHLERLVHVSSLGAGDDAPSHYARSKAAGEGAMMENFPKAMILRPSIIFGPEDSFFNRFAQMAAFLPFLPLIGGGHTKFQPVYVGDVAQAVLAALTRDEAMGKIYELGGDEVFSFKTLMQKIFEVTGMRRPLVPVPFFWASFKGAILQNLPGQLLTVDQVRSLKADNVLSGTKPGLRDLGITPKALDAVLPDYLSRFRKGGRFAQKDKKQAA